MKSLRSMIIPAVVSVIAAFLFSSPVYAGPVYRIVMPLVRGEEARAELPGGRIFPLGKVTGLPTATRWPGYTASKWAAPGTVAASAVNAVHLTLSVEKDAGRTMSILPLHTVAPAAGDKAFITLDVPAGTGFFGGWAPPVGTRVLVRKADGLLVPLEVSGLPSPGDELIFDVEEEERPYIIDVENRPGGRVLGWYQAGPKVLARVIRPVRGVGRFGGTEFQGRGRIRANHSGVIDVSTAGRGVTGGFQILPFLRSKSKEMGGAWQLTHGSSSPPKRSGHCPERRLFSRETSFQEASFQTFSGTSGPPTEESPWCSAGLTAARGKSFPRRAGSRISPWNG